VITDWRQKVVIRVVVFVSHAARWVSVGVILGIFKGEDGMGRGTVDAGAGGVSVMVGLQ
jgi:hypothetical protein